MLRKRPKLGPRSIQCNEVVPSIFVFTKKEDAQDALMGWFGEQFDEDTPLVLLELFIDDTVLNKNTIARYEAQIQSVLAP